MTEFLLLGLNSVAVLSLSLMNYKLPLVDLPPICERVILLETIVLSELRAELFKARATTAGTKLAFFGLLGLTGAVGYTFSTIKERLNFEQEVFSIIRS